jgi:hypothetical protein
VSLPLDDFPDAMLPHAIRSLQMLRRAPTQTAVFGPHAVDTVLALQDAGFVTCRALAYPTGGYWFVQLNRRQGVKR